MDPRINVNKNKMLDLRVTLKPFPEPLSNAIFMLTVYIEGIPEKDFTVS